ncbi:pyrimidine 5-nucleotidase [Athelia psychrophila]|uniref:Pyrimidine 5-nucleotidase n=1 Tax=Athelia psychrophila TaxID=1759441 RepID=A0A166VQH7_9AGAM|nr:pyrimidine 5-nucleotidase [Fibularhizoctonia sp. CBS 109695]
MSPSQKKGDTRPVIWLDIDNTLYPASAKVAHAMGEKIHEYFFENSIGVSSEELAHLSEQEATKLRHERARDFHGKYYAQHGLALRGLVLHHSVDATEFDEKCDQALRLEDMIKPDDAVIQLLDDIDQSKYRIWGLTNAYKYHAERVLEILQLRRFIEGLVYCDYTKAGGDLQDLVCKPDPGFYHKANVQANVTDPSQSYFIDDNRRNIDAAKDLGWGHCAHLHETRPETQDTAGNGAQSIVEHIGSTRKAGALANDAVVISNLQELRAVWPEVFKK